MQDVAADPVVRPHVQQPVGHPVVMRAEAEVGERRLVGCSVREVR
ncbi:hypothetical protein ACWEWI_14225 [Streptomyces sp. NPDC003753]|nr:hypothetical protein [Streptomyces sp. Y2F8-2]